jgi:multiple sugar transport system permease protein
MGTVAGGTHLESATPVPAVPTLRPPARRVRLRPGRVVKYTLMTLLAILFIAPFIYMVSASFLPLSQMFKYPPQWIPLHPTLSNYTGFFTSNHPIGRWIVNSIITTGTITVAQLFTSSLVAYTFAKRKWPGRDFLFFLGLATLMLPFQVTMIPNYLILKAVPLFGGNNIAGVGGHGWLDSYLGIIIPNLMNPFGIFLLRQYMISIPNEMIDAARVDGAGHFRIYWKVILPMSRPALAALAIFTFQFWWQAFFWPLIIISSPQLYTLPLGLALFQQANRTVWNLIMAGSVLGALPLIIVFFIFQKQFVRGISLSGSKG